jgi:hypothetical protein
MREASYTKAIQEAASRLEISEERAAELVSEINADWRWAESDEPRGLTFQDWLELMELAGGLEG